MIILARPTGQIICRLHIGSCGESCGEFHGEYAGKREHDQGVEPRVRIAGTSVGGCKTRRIMTGPVTRWCVAVAAAGTSGAVVQVREEDEL
jgi:hypothetical protein